MYIDVYREYCLSLGTDVEEKLPFVKFKNGEGVLVFYVCGHMFAFFDCNDYHVISLKRRFLRKTPLFCGYFALIMQKNLHISLFFLNFAPRTTQIKRNATDM